MSIINEALRKAEEEKKAEQAKRIDLFDFVVPVDTKIIDAAKEKRETKMESLKAAVKESFWKSPYSWVLSLVGIICLFLFVTFTILSLSILKVPREMASVPQVESSPVTTDIQQAEPSLFPEIQPEKQKKAGILQNMFKPNTPLFKLSGIIRAKSYASAIINGKVVEIGDQVAGAQVIAIQEKEVKLLYKGEEIVLAIIA